MIASFSRALLQGLSDEQTDEEFDAELDASIAQIFDASVTKTLQLTSSRRRGSRVLTIRRTAGRTATYPSDAFCAL